MIIRNSVHASREKWILSLDPEVGEIVRDFLSGENDLMKLAGATTVTATDLRIFLEYASSKPICVERSIRGGAFLIRAIGSPHSLLIMGRTAEVLRGYLYEAPLHMNDRDENNDPADRLIDSMTTMISDQPRAVSPPLALPPIPST